jgi:hypothetical protein
LLTGSLVINQLVQNNYTVYCVNELPEIGKPATNLEQTQGWVYYNVSDEILYGYVDDMLSAGLGAPVDWYEASILLDALGFEYSGVISNVLDDPGDGTFRLLLEYVLYFYKEGKWTSNKTIGWAGTGPSAEIFNHPSNKALGDASHAEGLSSYAEGFCSHAEGSSSIAGGSASHAEGSNSLAKGNFSHAEGLSSCAFGRSQHVQGEYNIPDPDANTYNPDQRGRYAHIVGNGTYLTKSNAHTLDWYGNATFAGVVTGIVADYAEYFEWADGNPNDQDRVGMIVTLEGDKIRPATASDDILGVVSATAMVLGDNAEWEWRQKYLYDDYGRVITEMIEEFRDEIDRETGETRKISMGFHPHRKLNPNYDPERIYVRRSDRPEWEIIGLIGKLHVTDDGTCIVGGYATVGANGIATASTNKTSMRVMKRITDSVILVLMK